MLLNEVIHLSKLNINNKSTLFICLIKRSIQDQRATACHCVVMPYVCLQVNISATYEVPIFSFHNFYLQKEKDSMKVLQFHFKANVCILYLTHVSVTGYWWLGCLVEWKQLVLDVLPLLVSRVVLAPPCQQATQYHWAAPHWQGMNG